MATKKRPPKKANKTKPKKAKPSEHDKVMKRLPPAREELVRILNNEPGYTRA